MECMRVVLPIGSRLDAVPRPTIEISHWRGKVGARVHECELSTKFVG